MRFIETLDKIWRSSVIDATKECENKAIAPGNIAERHFTLHTAEQIQQPVMPKQPTTEAPKDSDWIVDAGEEGVHRPSEQRITISVCGRAV